MSCEKVYISLGKDCAVAHNLRELGLTREAFPFDWIRLDSIKMIKETLELSFSNFFKNFEIVSQNPNFFSENDINQKSLCKLILSNKIVMPHECIGDNFDRKNYEQKYFRRIERFNRVVQDGSIHKVFVRSDDKITDRDKLILYSALDEYGVLNYSIIFINYSENISKIQSNFDWRRNYIDWKEYLSTVNC
jgi:hypothetical protein